LRKWANTVHIVTYSSGQDDIVIRVAKVHRTGPFRPQRNIKVGPSAVKFLLDFAVLRWLCRLIQSEPIDIIHRHNYEGTVIGVLAGWITRRPVPRRHVSGQMFYLSNQLTTRSLTAMRIFTAFATYWKSADDQRQKGSRLMLSSEPFHRKILSGLNTKATANQELPFLATTPDIVDQPLYAQNC
jgi:hypothetical protein